MTWRVVIDTDTEDDAKSIIAVLDMASQEASALDDVKSMHMHAFEVCEQDYMAGQLCQLPAGHLDNEGTPHQ